MKRVIFLLVISILFSCIQTNTWKKYTRMQEYKGVINKIYKDETNHMVYTFNIKISNGEILTENVGIWPHIWKYAKVGDSIIKPADTLMIIVKKRDASYREFFCGY